MQHFEVLVGLLLIVVLLLIGVPDSLSCWSSGKIKSDPEPRSSIAATTTMTSSVPDRVRGALWGMFIGDSIAMPVHW